MSAKLIREKSEIHKTAVIRSPELIEHPVNIRNRAELAINVSIGAFSFVNIDTIIYRNVKIGRYCSFARGCEIGAGKHPTSMLSSHSFQYSPWMFPKIEEYQKPRTAKYSAHPHTTLGSDVWIAAQSVVVAGVKIGHGAIVAANSVVTKDVAPYAIVGGSPAKLIKYRFDHEIILGLLQTSWWELPHTVIRDLPFDDLPACITLVRDIKKTLSLTPSQAAD